MQIDKDETGLKGVKVYETAESLTRICEMIEEHLMEWAPAKPNIIVVLEDFSRDENLANYKINIVDGKVAKLKVIFPLSVLIIKRKEENR